MQKIIFIIFMLIPPVILAQRESLKYQPPVNPNATEEAVQLLKMIYEISGQKVLSGQHNYIGHESDHSERIFEMTGKYPVVWGSDFAFADSTNDKDGIHYRQKMVEEIKERHKNGAVITLMWHVCRPIDEEPCAWKPSVQNEVTDEEWKAMLTPGTRIHKNWANQVDEIAGYLKQLQQAGIPILWRPYHEMNGEWFWWGHKEGPGGYKKLWKMLYNRLTHFHNLNNLIWVWNPNAPNYADDYKPYYPGHDYVDILAADIYGNDYKKEFHDRLLELGDGKPIALGEVGGMPTPEILEEQPYWAWFMCWAGFMDDEGNTPSKTTRLYDDSKVVDLTGFTKTDYYQTNYLRINKFIRVSQKDPRYLENSDGSPYIPIGLNMIGAGGEKGLTKMKKWVDQLAQNRGNYVRLWLSHDLWDVEHSKSGQYDGEKAQRIDEVLAYAREKGIKVKMTFEHFRQLHGVKWSSKPLHHVENGGTAVTMKDFFTGQASREQFKEKMNWYENRYGDDPNIFAWELWNEVNTTEAGGMTPEETREELAWTTTMLPALKHRWPHNMVTQSLGSFDNEEIRKTYRAFNKLESNEIANVHRYLDLGASLQVCHGPVDVLTADAVREIRGFDINKPVILAESGAVEPNHTGPFKLYEEDTAGIILHDVLFAPFFAGSAGTGQIWHWDDYVDANNLWHHFDRFAQVVKGVDPDVENFTPKLMDSNQLRIYLLKGEKTTLVWCRNKANSWKDELANDEYPALLSGIKIPLKSLDYQRNEPARIRTFDPWKNQWQNGRIRRKKLLLPDFRRSLVIKIEK